MLLWIKLSLNKLLTPPRINRTLYTYLEMKASNDLCSLHHSCFIKQGTYKDILVLLIIMTSFKDICFQLAKNIYWEHAICIFYFLFILASFFNSISLLNLSNFSVRQESAKSDGPIIIDMHIRNTNSATVKEFLRKEFN